MLLQFCCSLECQEDLCSAHTHHEQHFKLLIQLAWDGARIYIGIYLPGDADLASMQTTLKCSGLKQRHIKQLEFGAHSKTQLSPALFLFPLSFSALCCADRCQTCPDAVFPQGQYNFRKQLRQNASLFIFNGERESFP